MRKLCMKLCIDDNDDEYSFAHLFVTFEWNLMSPSENLVDCYIENIFGCAILLAFNSLRPSLSSLGNGVMMIGNMSHVCQLTLVHTYVIKFLIFKFRGIDHN